MEPYAITAYLRVSYSCIVEWSITHEENLIERIITESYKTYNVVSILQVLLDIM